MGIMATAKEKFQSDDIKGMRISVQGLGNVGTNLVKYLVEAGAKVTVSDIDTDKIKKHVDLYKVASASSDQILFTDCEILAPCAMGAVVNDQSIGKFKCKAIAGGANNLLAESKHGDQLRELGILYAPDYVVNAGGLMNVFVELEGYSPERSFEKTRKVYDNVLKVFEIAKRDNIGTHTAADRLAEERMKTIGNLKRRHPGKAGRVFTTLKEVNNR
jgi:leucine dehydrogenase